MIVQCPNCKAKYNLPDQKIGPDGAKLRCGKCKHVFQAGKQAPAAATPPPPPPPKPAPTPPAPPKSPPPKPAPAPESEDDQDIFAGMDDDLFGPSPGKDTAASSASAPSMPSMSSMEDEGDFEPPSDFDYPDFGDATDEPEPQRSAAPARSAQSAPGEDAFQAPEPEPAPRSAPSPEPSDDGFPETPADFDEPVKPGFSLDDVANEISGKRRPLSSDKKKRIIILAAVFLVLLLATGGALYFLDLLPGMGKPAPEKAQTETPAAPAETPAAPENAPAKTDEAKKEAPANPEESAKVKNIVLQNVRQYFVTNDKAGQLCVIEGKAVNKFKTPKEMIKLKANLFDDKGAVIAEQSALCGNTVSLFQLQVMTKDELETALKSQVGVLTNNTNIQPDGETPFMFVFFNVPDNLAEFVVKVVDAKDPPKQ